MQGVAAAIEQAKQDRLLRIEDSLAKLWNCAQLCDNRVNTREYMFDTLRGGAHWVAKHLFPSAAFPRAAAFAP
jgi:hypothetical protein